MTDAFSTASSCPRQSWMAICSSSCTNITEWRGQCAALWASSPGHGDTDPVDSSVPCQTTPEEGVEEGAGEGAPWALGHSCTNCWSPMKHGVLFILILDPCAGLAISIRRCVIRRPNCYLWGSWNREWCLYPCFDSLLHFPHPRVALFLKGDKAKTSENSTWPRTWNWLFLRDTWKTHLSWRMSVITKNTLASWVLAVFSECNIKCLDCSLSQIYSICVCLVYRYVGIS